jgi:hypothetical protein
MDRCANRNRCGSLNNVAPTQTNDSVGELSAVVAHNVKHGTDELVGENATAHVKM